MIQLKLRRTGNSLSTIWPKELIHRLNVREGDRLFAVETADGVLVTPPTIRSSRGRCAMPTR